jgi:hypothetical protein
VHALTTAQFEALTTSQLIAIETADLAGMTTGDIHALTTAQVHALTSDQVDALSTDLVHAFSTAQIHALTTEDIQALGTDGIDAFSTSQLVSLTTDQYSSLTTDQFASLSSADIAALSTEQAHTLTTEQIHAFTTEQIHGLESGDIAAMTTDQMLAFTSDAIGEMDSAQLEAFLVVSPIVLDLSGHGVQTLSAQDGVNFDLLGTGHTSQVGWVGSGSALLARDINGDGIINNGTELFGAGTRNAQGQSMGNGYAALALEDTNHDGKISATDAHFKELKLWVDANHDGKTDAGELHGLAEFGIVELDLGAAKSGQLNNGNFVGLVSSYTTADGHSHEMADVWFAKDAKTTTPAATPHLHELLAAPQADLLGSQHASTQAVAASTGSVASATPLTMGHTGNSLRSLLDDERQAPLL